MNKAIPIAAVITIAVVVDTHPTDTKIGTLYVRPNRDHDSFNGIFHHLHTLEELPLWLQERIAVLCMIVPYNTELTGVGSIDGVGSVWDYGISRDFVFRPVAHNVPPEVIAQCITLCGREVGE